MSLNFSNNVLDNSDEKIQHELNSLLQDIFATNRKIMDGLNEIKTVSQWYRESRSDPDSIPSKIFNESIKEIVKYVVPQLRKYLIEKIKIETDIRKDEVSIENIEVIFSIKPFVEYIKRVDGSESDKVKVTFNLAFSGKAEGIQIYSKYNRKQIKIAKLSTSIEVSILKGEISISGVSINPITKPIELYHNELLKIENIELAL